MCYRRARECCVLSLGAGNEAARFHLFLVVDGFVAARCACPVSAEGVFDRHSNSFTIRTCIAFY